MDEREERVVKTRSTAGTQQNKEPQGKAKTKKYADQDAAGDHIDHSGCWGPDFLEAIWLIE